MNVLFLLLFLACLILLPLGLIKPDLAFAPFIKLGIVKSGNTRKKAAVFFSILLIVFAFFTLISAPKQSTEEQSSLSQENQSKTSNIDYEIVSSENNKTVENYWLLIKSQDKSRQMLETFVSNFKKEKCKKPCNVSLYDDQKAANLDFEYKELINSLSTEPAQLENWKKNNYVYVADHLVGYSEFSSNTYSEYPYKDFYYDELKAK